MSTFREIREHTCTVSCEELIFPLDRFPSQHEEKTGIKPRRWALIRKDRSKKVRSHGYTDVGTRLIVLR